MCTITGKQFGGEGGEAGLLWCLICVTITGLKKVSEAVYEDPVIVASDHLCRTSSDRMKWPCLVCRLFEAYGA